MEKLQCSIGCNISDVFFLLAFLMILSQMGFVWMWNIGMYKECIFQLWHWLLTMCAQLSCHGNDSQTHRMFLNSFYVCFRRSQRWPLYFTCQYVNRARGQGGWKDTAFGSMKSYVHKVLETEQVRAETFVELQDAVTHLPNHTECGIDWAGANCSNLYGWNVIRMVEINALMCSVIASEVQSLWMTFCWHQFSIKLQKKWSGEIKWLPNNINNTLLFNLSGQRSSSNTRQLMSW